MNVTLSIDDEVIHEARSRAENMGTSVNQLVREYLEQLAGKNDLTADAEEFDGFHAAFKPLPCSGSSIAKNCMSAGESSLLRY